MKNNIFLALSIVALFIGSLNGVTQNVRQQTTKKPRISAKPLSRKQPRRSVPVQHKTMPVVTTKK